MSCARSFKQRQASPSPETRTLASSTNQALPLVIDKTSRVADNTLNLTTYNDEDDDGLTDNTHIDFDNVKILKRNTQHHKNSDISKVPYPKLPYHQRWEYYLAKRNEIFNDFEVSEMSIRRNPKRSTLRLRKYYKNRKSCSKLLISAIVNNPNYSRYYAKVSFLNLTEYGHRV